MSRSILVENHFKVLDIWMRLPGVGMPEILCSCMTEDDKNRTAQDCLLSLLIIRSIYKLAKFLEIG